MQHAEDIQMIDREKLLQRECKKVCARARERERERRQTDRQEHVERLNSTVSIDTLLEYPLLKGMLYPRGNSELMCYKLPTIPRGIFWKFGLNFVPIIILSRNQISTLKIDPIHNHAKFHLIRSMEITVQVFDRTLWNLAWLYIESIFRVEIRLQLKILTVQNLSRIFNKFPVEL